MTENEKTDSETARDFAEGREPELKRDPVEDELNKDETLPDPEDEHLKRRDTHYPDPSE